MYPSVPIGRQRGIGLPLALFVVTVLALLVLGMSLQQQATGEAVGLQVQSQRAFLAAESGAQVAITDVLYEGRACPSTWTLNFTESALAACHAALSCFAEDASGVSGSGGGTLYTLVSAGTCGSGRDAARREVEVRVR